MNLLDIGMALYDKLPFFNLHSVYIHTIAYEVISDNACDPTNQEK